MTPLRFDLHAAGVLAPGLSSVEELCAVNAGQRPYVPATLQLQSPAMLPAQERRRSSSVVRLVLACIDQALHGWPLPAESLPTVFATDEGTGDVCQQMLHALSGSRQVSPLLFSNSVLNAPSGYFSIAWRSRSASTVVSLGEESFASGLLCAVIDAHANRQPTLLVAYDPPMPQPLAELLPIHEGTATAWIISASPQEHDLPLLATFTLEVAESPGWGESSLPGWMPEAWGAHGSARGLAAMGLLGRTGEAEMHLGLGGSMLALRRLPKEAV